MQDEFLPQVDEQGNIIGKYTREEFHHNPHIIHPVVHCWIFNKSGKVLWQQRSIQKKICPGMWDMSCGGHIAYGETPEQTLKRELAEELGLENVSPTLVDTYILSLPEQTELVYLYYLVIDSEDTNFVLQKEEVEQVKWINTWEAQMQFIRGEVQLTEFIISQVSRILQRIAADTNLFKNI